MVSDKNILHFLIFILLILVYLLYQKSSENHKMYQILGDQDETIRTQVRAIELQQIYIRQLQYSYGINQNSWESPLYDNAQGAD